MNFLPLALVLTPTHATFALVRVEPVRALFNEARDVRNGVLTDRSSDPAFVYDC